MLNQFFCFDVDTSMWRECIPFPADHKIKTSSARPITFEVVGSLAICFGGLTELPDNSTWYVFDLELTLKGFCAQELMKDKHFDISRLPAGLKRFFVQQGRGNKRKRTGQN